MAKVRVDVRGVGGALCEDDCLPCAADHPVHFGVYFLVPNLIWAAVFMLWGAVVGLLTRFAAGRAALLAVRDPVRVACLYGELHRCNTVPGSTRDCFPWALSAMRGLRQRSYGTLIFPCIFPGKAAAKCLTPRPAQIAACSLSCMDPSLAMWPRRHLS